MRLGLDNISKLLSGLENPQSRFESIHVAGTNGKGSTVAILESIFRHAGYKTGMFTSPHLINVTERIQINAVPIPIDKLTFYLNRYKDHIESLRCTYFETLTAIAFKYFADFGIDIAFVEVGLGGRLDATNVITPLLSIITQIDLDHTEHLGSTLVEIAGEKAEIIKPNVPCLAQSNDSNVLKALAEHALEMRAPLYTLKRICSIRSSRFSEDFSEFDLFFEESKFENLKLRLGGRIQVSNAALAVAATQILKEQFRFNRQHIYQGLQNVQWPGRLQKLQDRPKVVVDVAHNPAAIQELINAVRTIFQFDSLIILIGLLETKDFREISKIIASAAENIFVVTPDSERALAGGILCDALSQYSNRVVNCRDMEAGFRLAISEADENDLICVTGSHHTVGELLNFLKNT